jgi:hypothetical protein
MSTMGPHASWLWTIKCNYSHNPGEDPSRRQSRVDFRHWADNTTGVYAGAIPTHQPIWLIKFLYGHQDSSPDSGGDCRGGGGRAWRGGLFGQNMEGIVNKVGGVTVKSEFDCYSLWMMVLPRDAHARLKLCSRLLSRCHSHFAPFASFPTCLAANRDRGYYFQTSGSELLMTWKQSCALACTQTKIG